MAYFTWHHPLPRPAELGVRNQSSRTTRSEVDSGITRFNDPNEIVFDTESTLDAELVVSMPGTRGKASRALQLFNVIAAKGYRVIGLKYNDSPSVAQRCPRDPGTDCSAKFRQRRIVSDQRG